MWALLSTLVIKHTEEQKLCLEIPCDKVVYKTSMKLLMDLLELTCPVGMPTRWR